MKSRTSFLLLLSLCLVLLLSSCGFSNYNLPTDFSSVELIYENDPSRYYYNQLTDDGKTAYTLLLIISANIRKKLKFLKLMRMNSAKCFMRLHMIIREFYVSV